MVAFVHARAHAEYLFDDRIMEGERSGVSLAHWGPSTYPSSALLQLQGDTHRYTSTWTEGLLVLLLLYIRVVIQYVYKEESAPDTGHGTAEGGFSQPRYCQSISSVSHTYLRRYLRTDKSISAPRHLEPSTEPQ